jgi:hypothetical protein
MHFTLIATAATAAALCAAGPLPPPHLTPQKIREMQAYDFPQRLREDTKMTPPLEQKPQPPSHGEDEHICQKPGYPGIVVPPSGHPEQPGADAPRSVDRKPDAQPSNPSETQEASMRRRSEAAGPIPPGHQTSCIRGDHYPPPPDDEERRREPVGPLPPSHLPPRQLEEDTKITPPSKEKPELSRGDDDHITCRSKSVRYCEEKERSMEMRKALEKINGHGGAKPDVQPSNLPGKPEKSTRTRRTASPLSLPQQLTGISKEDRERS